MDKVTWIKKYLGIDEKADWSKQKVSIKKVSYGGEMETLKYTPPNIYKIFGGVKKQF